MFDWNDLRYFLAVAQHQGTAAAGRALKVDGSTVQRRLLELERRLGQPLVERHTSGYRLTNFGHSLLPHARRVDEAMLDLQKFAGESKRELQGLVRVTCPEPIAGRIARSQLLERFQARYPGIKVEFLMSDRYLDLAKGEADIALRSGDTEDEALIGRKIGDSLWAVYASRDYLARHDAPEQLQDLAAHPLLGLDESMSNHRAVLWLRQQVPHAKLAARNNSVLGLVHSAKAGLGLAPLPTALGDAEQDLVRVLGPIPELSRIWRILTTAQLRRTPHVGAFFDFVVEEVDMLKPILTG